MVKDVNFEWTIERLAYFFDDGCNWEPLTSAEFSVIKFELSVNMDMIMIMTDQTWIRFPMWKRQAALFKQDFSVSAAS